MTLLSRSEGTAHGAVLLAGRANDREFFLVSRALCMHPDCSPLPTLENGLVHRLADLASFAESVQVLGDGGTGITPQLADSWQRILKIELGNAVIRSAAKILLKKTGGIVIAQADGLPPAQELASFFPATPLILLQGKDTPPEEFLEHAALYRKKGHPFLLLKPGDLVSRPVKTMTELLEFVRLPAYRYRWKEFEASIALPETGETQVHVLSAPPLFSNNATAGPDR